MKRILIYTLLGLLWGYAIPVMAEQLPPGAVVTRALNSITGVLDAAKEEQISRIKEFSNCFINKETRKAALLPLLLRRVLEFRILNESLTGNHAAVDMELKTSVGTFRMKFGTVRLKEKWKIESVSSAD